MTNTKTATLIARNGIFDQADEEYQVIDAHGFSECDWTPSFSAAAEKYTELTGQEIDSAEYTVAMLGTLPIQVYTHSWVTGDLSEGLCICDDRAYSFWRGDLIAEDEGDRWYCPSGEVYEVVRNGDGTTWVEDRDGRRVAPHGPQRVSTPESRAGTGRWRGSTHREGGWDDGMGNYSQSDRRR